MWYVKQSTQDSEYPKYWALYPAKLKPTNIEIHGSMVQPTITRFFGGLWMVLGSSWDPFAAKVAMKRKLKSKWAIKNGLDNEPRTPDSLWAALVMLLWAVHVCYMLPMFCGFTHGIKAYLIYIIQINLIIQVVWQDCFFGAMLARRLNQFILFFYCRLWSPWKIHISCDHDISDSCAPALAWDFGQLQQPWLCDVPRNIPDVIFLETLFHTAGCSLQVWTRQSLQPRRPKKKVLDHIHQKYINF